MGGLFDTLFSAIDRHLLSPLIDDDLRDRIEAMAIPTNDFGYDRWGFSPETSLRALAVTRWFYRKYFRVETSGLEHIPSGRMLLIGNHSGQMAYDGMMVASALALEAEPPRYVRSMIERFFAEVPLVNTFMSRTGQLTGTQENAERLLTEENAAVLVFPEGERGGGKVWKDRYKIMGFGQGFLRLALKTKTPIVPFAFIGGEEMAVSFSRMKPLAKLMGAPYIPLSPTILPLPLPVKVSILFGECLHYEGDGNEDDAVIRPMVRDVESRVKALIDQGLANRESVFFG